MIQSTSSLTAYAIAVRSKPVATSMKAAFPMYLWARSLSPSPLAMAKSGDPPFPNRFWNAVMIVIMGNASPIPVSANEPAPGMWPR